MTVVTATTAEGRRAAFVVADPPTAEDRRRLAGLAAMPGLRSAEWSAAAGTDVR